MNNNINNEIKKLMTEEKIMKNRSNNILTYSDIKQSLVKYDESKSLFHKIVDREEIKSLRYFARDDNTYLSCDDLFKVIEIIAILSEKAPYGSAGSKVITNLQNEKEIRNLIAATDELKVHNIFTRENFEAMVTVRAEGYFNIYLSAAIALDKLNKAGMLTSENRDAVNQCFGYPVYLSSILISLNKAGILTQENRSSLVNHFNLEDVHYAVEIMQPPHATLSRYFLALTQENFDAIINNKRPKCFALELEELAKKGILNQQTRDAVSKHLKPEEMVQALLCLYDPRQNYIISKNEYSESIFTPENIHAISNHHNPLDVVKALAILYQQKILTPENRKAVKNHSQPQSLAFALASLNSKYRNLSLVEKMDIIITHSNPNEFYKVLYLLHEANLITSENCEAAKNYPNVELFAKVLELMDRKSFLTQSFFSRVIEADNPAKEFDALVSDLPRLKKETCHPYTKGAIRGLFNKVNPNLLARDITDKIAQYVSRSKGANIAKTCILAAETAREEEKKSNKIFKSSSL